jgi:hypothetical protein
VDDTAEADPAGARAKLSATSSCAPVAGEDEDKEVCRALLSTSASSRRSRATPPPQPPSAAEHPQSPCGTPTRNRAPVAVDVAARTKTEDLSIPATVAQAVRSAQMKRRLAAMADASAKAKES